MKTGKRTERKLRKTSLPWKTSVINSSRWKQLGSIESIIGMIPGLNKVWQLDFICFAEKDLRKTEAIINSIDGKGKVLPPNIIDGSRRVRIAKVKVARRSMM